MGSARSGYGPVRLTRILLALLLALAGSARAVADRSVTPTGEILAMQPGDIPHDAVNVKSFGAVGDDVADDTAAINAAFAHVRGTRAAAKVGLAAHVFFPQGVYKVTGNGINATGLRGFAVTIDGAGAAIDCQATGQVCLDALYSRWLRIRDLSIVGSAANTPRIGIQLGRANAQVADDAMVEDVVLAGRFGLTSLYNFAAETSKFDHVLFWNDAPDAYTLIQDGYNHFNARSAFIAETLPVDAASSFNENLFINCDFREGGGGPAIWIGKASRHKFIRSYIGNRAGPAIVLFGENGSPAADMLDADIHVETKGVADVFFMTTNPARPSASQTFNSLYYRDHSTQATNSIFKLDRLVRSASIRDLRLDVGGFQFGLAKIFDEPASWSSVSGTVNLPAGAANWNLPDARFTGCYTIGQHPVCDGIAFHTGVSGPLQLAAFNYAALPETGAAGREVFCADCRKPGEADGRGTGMAVFDDGHGHWVSMAGTVAAR